jgi:O-antigen/teichoic acid export membrane protein
VLIRPITNINLQGLGKNAFVYLVGLLLSNTLTFMIFPILAKGLSKGDFGLLDFYFSVGILVSVLLAFGIDSSIGRFLHEVEESEARNRLIFQSILIQSIFIITIVFILYTFAELIIFSFKSDQYNVLIFKLILIQAGFQAIINFALNLLKWTFQKWKFIILCILSAGLNLLCILISIFGYNSNLPEVLEAILIGKILSSLVGVYLIHNLIVFKMLSFDFLGRILKYAWPIGIICILEVALPVIERDFILKFLSTEELGQYAASAKFVAILAIVVQAFQSAWGPFSLSVRNQEMSHEGFVLTVKLYVFSISMCSLMLLIFGKFSLVLLTSAAYQDGWFLIFPMSISLIINSIGSITGIGLIISNRPYIQLVTYLIFIIISFVLISILTKQYGIFGTACAILLANVTRTIIISRLSQFFYFVAWPFKIISVIVFLNLFTGLIIILLMINSLYFLACIFFIVSIIFVSYYFWIYALNDYEKELIGLKFFKSNILSKLNL